MTRAPPYNSVLHQGLSVQTAQEKPVLYFLRFYQKGDYDNMGRVYAIAAVAEDMLRFSQRKLEETKQAGNTVKELVDLTAYLHWLSAIFDPYYTGCEEGTFTDRLFDLENLRAETRFVRETELLEDLCTFARVKVLDLSKDRRCTVPKDADTADYDVAYPETADPTLREDLKKGIEKFAHVLTQDVITADDVHALSRLGFLLECIDLHDTGNRSAREDGVSACERFCHAVHNMTDAREAFLRAYTILYTAAVYGVVRVRCERNGLPHRSAADNRRLLVKIGGGDHA